MLVRRALRFCKQKLIGIAGGSSEEYNADRNMKSKSETHEVLVGNTDSIRNFTRGQVYLILLKNLTTYCPDPKSLQETKIKVGEQIDLGEEISSQHTVQVVVWILLARCTV